MSLEMVYSGLCVLIAFVIILCIELCIISVLKFYLHYLEFTSKNDFRKAQAERMRRK